LLQKQKRNLYSLHATIQLWFKFFYFFPNIFCHIILCKKKKKKDRLECKLSLSGSGKVLALYGPVTLYWGPTMATWDCSFWILACYFSATNSKSISYFHFKFMMLVNYYQRSRSKQCSIAFCSSLQPLVLFFFNFPLYYSFNIFNLTCIISLLINFLPWLWSWNDAA
jgi:hypothetical protein